MRALALALASLALGLTVAACGSNETELENEGNTIDAPATSEQDELAMGDPQAAVANENANRVFFALDSAELSSATQQQLDRIATAYEGTPGIGMTLVGFTDTTGTREYNQELAGERAEAVQAYLVSKGVPAAEIETEAEGQAPQNVDTANGVREPANRRVRIEIAEM